MSTLDAASLPSSDSEDEDFVVSDHEDQPSTSAAKAQATAAQAGPKRGAPKQQVSPDAALAERLNSIGELLDDVRPAPAKAGASDTSTSLTQLAAQARKLGAKGLKVNKAKGIKGNAKARSTPSGVVAHILARGTAAQDKPAKAGKKRARTAVSAEALAFAEASLAKAGTGRLQLTQKVRYAGKDVEVTHLVQEGSAAAGKIAARAAALEAAAAVSDTALVAGATAANDSRLALGDVVSNLNNAKNITTLEKTNADWDSYKVKTGLVDELTAEGTGYVDRQDFLSRVDQRTFEVERAERATARAKAEAKAAAASKK